MQVLVGLRQIQRNLLQQFFQSHAGLAEMAAVLRSKVSGSSGSLSHLFSTVSTGTFSAPSSLSISIPAWIASKPIKAARAP